MSASLPISIRALTKYYNEKRAVEGITFDVHPGEVMGFLGPNGSGKTTVMRMLMGLIKISSGEAFINGIDVRLRDGTSRSSVGYLPGTLRLPHRSTVHELLHFCGSMRGNLDPVYLSQLIDRFNLDPSRKIGSLSKGTKQKVGVVQAFMHKPNVLILDEPTSGLDPIVQRDFEELLQETRNRGAAVLLSSHVMHEVETSAERVAILNKGSLLLVDSVHSLKDRMAHTLTFEFNSPVPIQDFQVIPGIQSVTSVNDSIVCTVVGAVAPALAVAAKLNAQDITAAAPSLEDIFISETGVQDVS